MQGNERGRPTKYKKEYAEQAVKLCKKGFTDKDLADFFEVDESTINRWKDKYEDFCASIKSAKKYSDDLVVQSLYNRAIGYSLTEEREESSNANGSKTVKVTKQIAGDTTAQIFWLKNRQPKEWRDKQETEHSGVINNVTYTAEDYANAQGNLENKL
ncbi:terminase small subunit, partial [Vibrio phage 209E38-1]